MTSQRIMSIDCEWVLQSVRARSHGKGMLGGIRVEGFSDGEGEFSVMNGRLGRKLGKDMVGLVDRPGSLEFRS